MMMENVTTTAMDGHISNARSPRHSSMEDSREPHASILTPVGHPTKCSPTTLSAPIFHLDVRDVMMFAQAEMETLATLDQVLSLSITVPLTFLMIILNIT